MTLISRSYGAFVSYCITTLMLPCFTMVSNIYFRWKAKWKSNRKLWESSSLFTGKNFGSFLYQFLEDFIYILKGRRTVRKYMLPSTLFVFVILHEWNNCSHTEHQQQRKEKAENKITKQENKWTEVTEWGFVWLRGLGAKSRRKSYFKTSSDLLNSRPIKREEN